MDLGWYCQGPGPTASGPPPPNPSLRQDLQQLHLGPALSSTGISLPESAKNTSVAMPLTPSPMVPEHFHVESFGESQP